ncbi:MAG: ABC transporter permease [Terracidiphilus sp.]|jgi:lipopolysaccharide transport system permease protein
MADLIIEPGRTEKNYWTDLWRFRQLFYFLAWRDILVRYKQTVVGVAWAVLRPFLTMAIFTIVFSRIAKLPSVGTAPYAILVMAGMLPWQFISASISASSESLVGSSNLISKIYFPRLIIPSSAIVTSFVDFLITLVLMAAMMLWYGFAPDWRLVFLPLFMILAFGCALGVGLWLSALMVEYRDVRHVVPFIVQVGMYVSPVGFSSNVVPAKWRLLYSLNPVVGIIDGFRWSLMRGQMDLRWPVLLLSVAISLVLAVSGIWYFRKTERTFADVI